jgi:hypothetical protein
MSKLRQVTLISSTIDSSPIGATTPSTGAFTGLTGAITVPSETPCQGSSSAIVGTGADVAAITFPALGAGRIQASKGMRLTLVTQHGVGSGAVTYKLKFNGTIIESFAVTPQNNIFFDIHRYLIFNNSAVSNAQHWFRESTINNSGNTTQIPAASSGTASQDFTAAQTITFTFNAANTEQVQPIFALIELIQ